MSAQCLAYFPAGAVDSCHEMADFMPAKASSATCMDAGDAAFAPRLSADSGCFADDFRSLESSYGTTPRARPQRQLSANYEMVCELQSGSTAKVYLAEHLSTGTSVAVKRIEATDASVRKFAEREIAMQTACSAHPNIATLHEAYTDDFDGSVSLVMEYMPHDLLDLIYASAGRGLHLADVLHYSSQIAHALSWMHTQGVAHRDIKCENVCVTADGSVRIVDFGQANLVHDTRQRYNHMTGTVNYAAPECWTSAISKNGDLDASACGCACSSSENNASIDDSKNNTQAANHIYYNNHQSMGSTIASPTPPSSPTDHHHVQGFQHQHASNPSTHQPMAQQQQLEQQQQHMMMGYIPQYYDLASADVWSFGVLVYCLATAHFPWKRATMDDPDFAAFARGQIQESPQLWGRWQSLPLSVKILLEHTLVVDPAKRWNMATVSAYLDKIIEVVRVMMATEAPSA